MDGLKLAHAVHNRWPPIKIIVTSGHRMAAEHELPEGGRFFAKPYYPSQIRGVLREWGWAERSTLKHKLDQKDRRSDLCFAYVICHHCSSGAKRLRAAFRRVASGLVLHLRVELAAEQDDHR